MSQKRGNGINRWAILMGIGMEMGLVIYLFVKGGTWLDENYNVGGKGFTVLFTLLGVALSLVLVVKQTNRLNK